MKHVFIRIYQNIFGLVWRNFPLRQPKAVTGEEAFFKIPGIVKAAGKSHPLIVTGSRMAGSEDFEKMAAELPTYTLFSNVEHDPSIATALAIAKVYEENRCDCYIAIGGGSYLDAAKAASAQAARPGKSLYSLTGTMKVLKKTPFFVAVPTTAGTGSEATVASVVLDERTGRKLTINDPVLMPDVAVLDPALTLTLPPHLTAETGMDALTHAIEAYLNIPYRTEKTASLCREAVKEIFSNLPKAYADGADIETRSAMLLASFKAGKAFTVACVGYVHAIAHAIGAKYHLTHGRTIAIVLPKVLAAYGQSAERSLAELARYCDIARGQDAECAKRFIAHIRELNRSMGIPETIARLKEADFADIARAAAKEAVPLYPTPVIFSQAELFDILRSLL